MIDERLSAYLDGECDADEVQACIGTLTEDAATRGAWQRQLWAREALRGIESPPALDAGFADRVSAALEAEDQPAGDKVVSLASRRRRWLGPAAGLAAAASMAAAVVLVVDPRPTGEPGTMQASNLSPEVADAVVPVDSGLSADVQETAVPVASDMVALSGGGGPGAGEPRRGDPADHWSVSDPAVEEQLNGYLIEHNGLARGYGLSGATPSFVRVATYGQGEAR